MNYKILTSIIVFALSSAVHGVEVGQLVQGTIAINGRAERNIYATFPLVEGEWSVEYSKLRSNSSNSDFRDLNFFQFENGKLKLAAEYIIKVGGSGTQWLDEPCKVQPTLHKNDYGTRIWKQKCLVIEAIPFLQSNNEPTRLALNSLSKRGMKNDFNSLRMTYTRYGDSDKFMIVRLHFFPSVYGLENPTVGIINTSPWNPSNIPSDPGKTRFVNALIKYSERLVQSLDLAYETGNASAPIAKFSYPDEVDSSKATIELPSKEVRLRDLKGMFEKNLITKEIYEAQQNKILNN